MPYGMGDDRQFHGRQQEIFALVDAVNVSSLTIVYGPPGAGKSSLLKAGLADALLSAHRLEPSPEAEFYTEVIPKGTKWKVILPDVDDFLPKLDLDQLTVKEGEVWGMSQPAEVQNSGAAFDSDSKLEDYGQRCIKIGSEWFLQAFGILEAVPNTATQTELEPPEDLAYQVLSKLGEDTNEGRNKILVLFDQFERILGKHGMQPFIDILARALNCMLRGRIPSKYNLPDSLPEVKVLICLRHDSLHLLDILYPTFDAQSSVRVSINYLSKADAEAAIREPARAHGDEFASSPFDFDNRSLDLVLAGIKRDDARRGDSRYDPLLLQLACMRIEDEVIKSQAKRHIHGVSDSNGNQARSPVPSPETSFCHTIKPIEIESCDEPSAVAADFPNIRSHGTDGCLQKKEGFTKVTAEMIPALGDAVYWYIESSIEKASKRGMAAKIALHDAFLASDHADVYRRVDDFLTRFLFLKINQGAVRKTVHDLRLSRVIDGHTGETGQFRLAHDRLIPELRRLKMKQKERLQRILTRVTVAFFAWSLCSWIGYYFWVLQPRLEQAKSNQESAISNLAVANLTDTAKLIQDIDEGKIVQHASSISFEELNASGPDLEPGRRWEVLAKKLAEAASSDIGGEATEGSQLRRVLALYRLLESWKKLKEIWRDHHIEWMSQYDAVNPDLVRLAASKSDSPSELDVIWGCRRYFKETFGDRSKSVGLSLLTKEYKMLPNDFQSHDRLLYYRWLLDKMEVLNGELSGYFNHVDFGTLDKEEKNPVKRAMEHLYLDWLEIRRANWAVLSSNNQDGGEGDPFTLEMNRRFGAHFAAANPPGGESDPIESPVNSVILKLRDSMPPSAVALAHLIDTLENHRRASEGSNNTSGGTTIRFEPDSKASPDVRRQFGYAKFLVELAPINDLGVVDGDSHEKVHIPLWFHLHNRLNSWHQFKDFKVADYRPSVTFGADGFWNDSIGFQTHEDFPLFFVERAVESKDQNSRRVVLLSDADRGESKKTDSGRLPKGFERLEKLLDLSHLLERAELTVKNTLEGKADDHENVRILAYVGHALKPANDVSQFRGISDFKSLQVFLDDLGSILEYFNLVVLPEPSGEELAKMQGNLGQLARRVVEGNEGGGKFDLGVSLERFRSLVSSLAPEVQTKFETHSFATNTWENVEQAPALARLVEYHRVALEKVSAWLRSGDGSYLEWDESEGSAKRNPYADAELVEMKRLLQLLLTEAEPDLTTFSAADYDATTKGTGDGDASQRLGERRDVRGSKTDENVPSAVGLVGSKLLKAISRRQFRNWGEEAWVEGSWLELLAKKHRDAVEMMNGYFNEGNPIPEGKGKDSLKWPKEIISEHVSYLMSSWHIHASIHVLEMCAAIENSDESRFASASNAAKAYLEGLKEYQTRNRLPDNPRVPLMEMFLKSLSVDVRADALLGMSFDTETLDEERKDLAEGFDQWLSKHGSHWEERSESGQGGGQDVDALMYKYMKLWWLGESGFFRDGIIGSLVGTSKYSPDQVAKKAVTLFYEKRFELAESLEVGKSKLLHWRKAMTLQRVLLAPSLSTAMITSIEKKGYQNLLFKVLDSNMEKLPILLRASLEIHRSFELARLLWNLDQSHLTDLLTQKRSSEWVTSENKAYLKTYSAVYHFYKSFKWLLATSRIDTLSPVIEGSEAKSVLWNIVFSGQGGEPPSAEGVLSHTILLLEQTVRRSPIKDELTSEFRSATIRGLVDYINREFVKYRQGAGYLQIQEVLVDPTAAIEVP